MKMRIFSLSWPMFGKQSDTSGRNSLAISLWIWRRSFSVIWK